MLFTMMIVFSGCAGMTACIAAYAEYGRRQYKWAAYFAGWAVLYLLMLVDLNYGYYAS